MTLTRVHVNQHLIKSNHKHGQDEPVLSVKASGKTHRARTVEILGPSRVVYASPATGIKPLSCGARVWIETEAEVLITGDTGNDLA
jgi:hypothetical protein